MTSFHVRQATRNDRASVAWLVSRFTPLLLCQAQHRISPSLRRFCDPDDAVADVWMVVLAKLSELAPAAGSYSLGLLRFASTVLIRRIRDLLEKHVLNKPQIASLDEPEGAALQVEANARGVVTHVVSEERRGRVWATLSELSPEDREIVVLRGIEGRAHKDVAERVGMSVDAVAARYSRTLKRLRELVPASVFDDLED
jgi:RNA polymerase sigma factor (sigma-70 family)